MKALQHSTGKAPTPPLEAPIHGLFRRWPALLGFSVQDADALRADGESAQIENELYLALLRGRSFARTVH